MSPDDARVVIDPGQTNCKGKTESENLLPQVKILTFRLVFSLALSLAICTRIGDIATLDSDSGVLAAANQLLGALANPTFLLTVVLGWAGVYLAMLLAGKAKAKPYIVLMPLAAFFGFAMVFGYSLDVTGDIGLILDGRAQLIKGFVAMLGWGVLFYLAGTVVFDFLERRMDSGCFRQFRSLSGVGLGAGRAHKGLLSIVRFVFDKHAFAVPFLILLVAWMPAIVGYAPALFLGDTPVQLAMWYGIENCVSDLVELLDPRVTITTHHPVLHTIILGACVQYGTDVFGSAMGGMYLYIRIQLAFTLACFAYGFVMLKRFRVAYGLRLVCLLLFALVPCYAEYEMLVSKDVPFAAALLVFCLQLMYLAYKRGSLFDWIVLAIAAFVVALFRNGGELFAFVGLAVLTILLYARRDSGGNFKAAFVLVAAVVLVSSSFSYYTLAVMHVTPGNRIEALSVPVQQTARYMRDYPDEVTAEERMAIDDVLGFDGLGERYTPQESDAVKNYGAALHGDAPNEAWARYFSAWMAMGARHPLCYAAATMENYYGYFYVSKLDLFNYTYEHSQLNARAIFNDTGLRIHMEYAPESKVLAGFCDSYLKAFESAPILGLLLRPAVWCWGLLLFTALCLRRKWRAVYPAVVTLWFFMLVFLVGPCNGATYSRYAYPLAVVLPYAYSILLAGAGARLPKVGRLA